MPVLEHLSLGFLAGVGSLEFTPTTDGKTFTADMVDDLARAHFPPCMRTLWQALRRDKHLKHGGRQQFSLFLKVAFTHRSSLQRQLILICQGIGLSVEEAVIFWRKAFSTINEDKFNKEYRYNIRHNYGLEGSRRDYQPKSCGQIIRETPGPNDSHGCPFRHFGEAQLGQMLVTSCGISNAADSKDIFDAVKGGHYHIACTRVFEITHASKGVQKGQGLGNGESVEHPNRCAIFRAFLSKSPRKTQWLLTALGTFNRASRWPIRKKRTSKLKKLTARSSRSLDKHHRSLAHV